MTHRERRTALRLVQSTRVLDVVQHAFAPQGGGRIEDAMRRVTAAPRSWRVGSIESRPDLGSRSFSILLQVADSCLFLKQKTYSEFVVRKHAKTAQPTRRFFSVCVTEEKREEYKSRKRAGKQHNLLADFRKGTILMKPTRHVFTRNSKLVFCSKNFSYQYDLDRPQAATSAKRSHFGDF